MNYEKIKGKENEFDKKNFSRFVERFTFGLQYELKFGSEFTGIEGVDLGESTVINSPFTRAQLAAAIYLKVDKELLEKIKDHSQEINKDEWIRNKILKGLKILDLGCGPEPTFARSARRLGADVYTVDVLPVSEFGCGIWKGKEEGWQKECDFFPEELQELEKMKHIQLDLRSKDALAKIIEKTGGNFDLVTSAHLASGYEYQGKEIYPPCDIEEQAMKLLRIGGLFQSAPGNSIEIKK